MRIAYVYDLIYPFSKGGVEKRVAAFSRGLVSRGHEVHVFGTKQWDGPDQILLDGVVLHGVPTTHRLHSQRGRRSIWQGVTFAFALGRRLMNPSFDLIDVQAMAPLSALVTVVMGRLKGIPTLVTWHEVWRGYWREYLGPIGHIGAMTERLLAKMGRSHAAVSHTTATRLAHFGLENVRLLPNGVETPSARRADGGVGDGVVYIGRLAPHKNLEMLIDSARVLDARGLNPPILIIGDGPSRESLERMAGGLENVQFLGPVESDRQVSSLVESARVFALPSLREGFGLAALEALACGVPVVTSDHPDNAASELIDSGVNGFVVAADRKVFAQAIETLLGDDGLHREMAANAHATAASFSIQRVLDRVESIYWDVAVRGRFTGDVHSSASTSVADVGGRG